MSTELTLRAMDEMFRTQDNEPIFFQTKGLHPLDLARHIANFVVNIPDTDAKPVPGLSGLLYEQREEFKRRLCLQSHDPQLFEDLTEESRQALLEDLRAEFEHTSSFADTAPHAVQSIAQTFSLRLQKTYEDLYGSR